MPWEKVEDTARKIGLKKLKGLRLFDVFESERIGESKKSMAINFIFQDEEKTLTDHEIDEWMKSIMTKFEKDLQAEIRK
jgi:phenylalanyl-tRNA synthetase beta chain